MKKISTTKSDLANIILDIIYELDPCMVSVENLDKISQLFGLKYNHECDIWGAMYLNWENVRQLTEDDFE